MHQAVETLESRVLFALTITPREQELLEMLNRMRTNPQGELKILLNTKDADVQDALSFFNVNLTVLAQQFAKLTPAQPLAWDASLNGAAMAHSQAMIDADQQTHQAPGEQDLATRIKAAGYQNMSVAGENVFAFADSMFHAHASFAIDWGNDTDGIQNPPGHRDNMMNADYREIGMGILDAPSGKTVGPIVVTQDFGDRFNFGNSYLLGVVYTDANHDGQYNAGEGIGGASITLSGPAGTFSHHLHGCRRIPAYRARWNLQRQRQQRGAGRNRQPAECHHRRRKRDARLHAKHGAVCPPGQQRTDHQRHFGQ